MIRQATLHDAEEIARIHILTWRAAYAGIVPDSYLRELSPAARSAQWRARLTGSTEGAFVAEEGPEIVGWILFGPSRDEGALETGEIYAVYVQPDRWGRGHGVRLMESAEGGLWRLGVKSITLWVLERNQRSRAFYSKAGYRPDETRKQIRLGGRPLWEMRYAKHR
jgi:GNAT superfamily N-acetyltransferase